MCAVPPEHQGEQKTQIGTTLLAASHMKGQLGWAAQMQRLPHWDMITWRPLTQPAPALHGHLLEEPIRVCKVQDVF